MSKAQKFIWILSLALLATIAFIAASVFLAHKKVEAPTTPGEGDVGASGASSIIMYSDTGFSPTPTTLAVGTTATWSNESSRSLWVYPSNDGEDYCIGQDAPTSFNQCTSIEKGGSYSYTFTEPGTYTYHNQDRPADVGVIYVTADSTSAGKINPDAIPQ